MILKNGYLELFNDHIPERGGHSYRTGKLINKILRIFGKYAWISDIGISLCSPRIGYYSCWYDGPCHSLWLGIVNIGWGGAPHYKQSKEWIFPKYK